MADRRPELLDALNALYDHRRAAAHVQPESAATRSIEELVK
jgi:hypothetical protein